MQYGFMQCHTRQRDKVGAAKGAVLKWVKCCKEVGTIMG